MIHAPLSPSFASRLVACRGARLVAACFPQEDTIDQREGNAAHWAASQQLNWHMVALGQVADNGVTLTEEMIDASITYVDTIMQRGCGVGQVERLVRNAVLHSENYGTPDHWQYDKATKTLYVDDFKYGRKYVCAPRNWQLINYAALILFFLGLYDDPSIKVVMTIVQPRNYHRLGPVRSWEMTSGTLVPYWRKLAKVFEEAMLPDAPVTANDPDECDDCPGRFACEAHIAATYWGVDVAYSSSPLDMSPKARGHRLLVLKRAEEFIVAGRKGLEEAIKSDMLRGRAPPQFTIAHGKGRTVFRDDAIENGILDVAAALGKTISKPTKAQLITPLQAIKAGIPAEVIQMYSHTPGGAAELVEVDADFAANIFNTKE